MYVQQQKTQHFQEKKESVLGLDPLTHFKVFLGFLDFYNLTKPLNMITWTGVGLHMSVTPRSCQSHLKVTKMSNQPKRVQIVSFCSNCVCLGCL